MNANTYGLPPEPAGTTADSLWEPWDEDTVMRRFVGTTRVVDVDPRDGGPVTVGIGGLQYHDGRQEWSVELADKDPSLTPAEARELAIVLIAAADEITRRLQA